MNKNPSTQNRALSIVLVILVAALVAALGYIIWQKQTDDTSVTSETSHVAETSQKEATPSDVSAKTGIITGSLTYPSEAIPKNLEVHAVNLETGKEYTTKEHLSGEQYKYGVGYRIEVPVGTYNVYGTLAEMPGEKAYYNQVIVCGVKVECTDTTKVNVKVEANKETADAMVGDWWTPPAQQ